MYSTFTQVQLSWWIFLRGGGVLNTALRPSALGFLLGSIEYNNMGYVSLLRLCFVGTESEVKGMPTISRYLSQSGPPFGWSLKGNHKDT